MSTLALAALALLAGDLVFNEEAKPFDSNIALQDDYGVAVAIDGARFVAGSLEDQQIPDTGRIYVWERNGTSWSSTAQLVPAGIAVDRQFGQLVAVDGDVVVGVHQWSSGAPQPQINVFEFGGFAWNEVKQINPSLPVGAQTVPRVDDVAVSGDLVVVGFTSYPHPSGTQTGAAVVYERQGTDWGTVTETVLFPGALLANDDFGAGVAVDGDTIAVGAPGYDVSPALLNAGRVHVFERSGTAWTETGALIGTFPDLGDNLGVSVAVSDGLLAAGVPDDTLPPGSREGAVETWRQSPTGSWDHLAKVRSAQPLGGEQFGTDVALDGGRLAVGAPESGSGGDRGAAWMFTLHAGIWTQQQKIIPSDAVGGMRFGQTVGVSGDRVVAGAPGDFQFAGNKSGSAYVLRFDAPPPVVYCTAKQTSGGCLAAIALTGNATLTGDDELVIRASDVSPGKSGLFFYGTTGAIAVPFLGGTLCVNPPLFRTIPQSATSGAGPCDGTYSYAFSQALLAAEGLDPGDSVFGQWWMRDPPNPDGTGVALSNAIEIVVGS